MKSLFGTLMIGGVLLGSLVAPIAHSGAPDKMFLVRSTAKSPEAVVEAVKAYAEGKKWQYLRANRTYRREAGV